MDSQAQGTRWHRGCASVAVFLLVSFACLPGALAAPFMAMKSFSGERISVDGLLREWPSNLDRLRNSAGSPSGHSALVGYDDRFVYLAAKLQDRNLIRTPTGGQGEDRLVLSLYVPGLSEAEGTTHEIVVYPGVPGKMPALVKIDGRKDSGSTAVEAPSPDGITLEARIPWSSLESTAKIRIGFHGVVRYFDSASLGRVQSVTATGEGKGRNMPALTTAVETGLIQSLLIPKGLPTKPAREAYGDLTGQGGAEKVALYGHFLSIVGPGYKEGRQFYFNELDVAEASQVTRLSLLDMSGDGRAEIILQKRLGKPSSYREVIQILQLGPQQAPLQIFAHEIAIVSENGQARNDVALSGRGSSARLVITQGQSSGFDPASYREPSIGGGIESALLPWQTVKSRTYGWKGTGLALLSEETWEPKMAASTTSTVTIKAPPPPRAPTADELLDRVYALYKSDRGVAPTSKARFDFVTNVAEGPAMERVLVHGRDLIVFGKDFKSGRSYTYLTIGVKEENHILSITTRDLVGDGRAEIVVHAVLQAQASESLGGETVERQALLVYKVVGESLQRIFAAETGRGLGGNRILGAVAFLPRPTGPGVEIELRSNRSLGWTQGNYPFPEDQQPAGGLQPLLLPWGSVENRHYVFDGSAFVLR